MESEIETSDLIDRIVLPNIIPLEVLHTLSRKTSLDFNVAIQVTETLMSYQRVYLADVTLNSLRDSIKTMEMYKNYGIGGRDALILATMIQEGVQTIVTNDKCILAIDDFVRINPIFSPPLRLELGETFDLEDYKKRVQSIVQQ